MKIKSKAIDLEHLQKYTGSDLKLEREIYSLFREQVRMWLKMLHINSDQEAWGSAAHSLKGSARGIGAHGLAAACEVAEAVVLSGRAEKSVAVDEVHKQVDAVIEFINQREYQLQIQDLRNSSQASNS